MKKNENECNLLYIVDSDFEENMIKTFEACLERDKKVIEELKLSFNLYLIYTQPNLALRRFFQESWEKKDEIKSLIIELNKKEVENNKINEEIKMQNKKIEDKNKELEKFEFEIKIEKIQNMPIFLDESIIDFIKKNKKRKFTCINWSFRIYYKKSYIFLRFSKILSEEKEKSKWKSNFGRLQNI